MIKDIKRAKEIIKILRSDVNCDRENLIKELQEIEDKHKLLFY